MPWEYYERMRSTLLPLFTYSIARVLLACGAYSPYALTFILRLIIGIAYWFVTCRLCLFLLPKLKTEIAKKAFVLLSVLLWYVPYISVRFTPENVAGLMFLWGFYLIMRSKEKASSPMISYLLAGLLFGIAFFIRIQMAFAIAGFLAWLLFVNKTPIKYFLVLGLVAGAAIGINIIIDHWYYHAWVLSPVNYFVANIIKHKSAEFGVDPWWFYFSEFVMKGMPPISIILLVFFFAGFIKNLRNPLVWSILAFLLIHFAIGHKELRFLFSMAFAFTYVVALGLDYLLTQPVYQKIHKYVYALMLIVGIPMLIYRSIIPACITINYMKYLYYNAEEKNTPALYNPADYENAFYHLDVGFYTNGNLIPVLADSASKIKTYLEVNRPKTAFYIGRNSRSYFDTIKGYTIDMAYTVYPDWIMKHDFNNWEERSNIWRIFKFTRVN